MPATALVDWEDAAHVAGRLARPGPVASRGELEDLVGALRAAAEVAVQPVLDITALAPADGRDLVVSPLSDVLVVDRAGWARAAARSMGEMTEGVLVVPSRPVPVAAQLASSAELGAALAFLSTKILGQFDPYGAREPGRLLLVAPNVLHAERQMGVRPADFRLWIALHEQTHALQFAAAPWLAAHLQERTQALVRGLAAAPSGWRELPPRLAALLGAVYRAVRGAEGGSIVDGILTREQKGELDAVTAVMALVEGHADVAMDAVGPRVVPSVRSIRRKFEKRRDAAGTADGVLKRLLGMDAKLAQYRDGAAFVRAVTRDVGTEGFNAVWTDRSTLPSTREIAEPTAWVRRVHG